MSTRDLVLSALFAAIIVALGILPPITLGFIPVPITAQSLGVMMAGVVLGARRATIAVLIVLVLVAIGLPVLSGGRGGLAALTTGFLSERLAKPEQPATLQLVGFFLAAVVGGIVVLYAFGIAYLAVAAQIGLKQAFVGSMAFIPGDVIKAFVAALVGRAVMAGYPLLPARS
jgi:biotin transport system substrate-specific component